MAYLRKIYNQPEYSDNGVVHIAWRNHFNKVMLLKANFNFCLDRKDGPAPEVYRPVHSKMYFSVCSPNQLDF